MAARRVVRHSALRKPVRSRVKVAPYVVPTRRGSPPPSAFMVPTKWVKFVVALFLLPLCAILSQTFFTAFARATVTERLWAGEEFWFFSLGAVLWLIAFFGLPRPIVLYVFGHELTHALWVLLMARRVRKFRVGREAPGAGAGLLLEHVLAICLLAQDAAGTGDLEPRLRAAVRLVLGHCFVSSSVRAGGAGWWHRP